MSEKDLYNILGVSREATQDEIKELIADWRESTTLI